MLNKSWTTAHTWLKSVPSFPRHTRRHNHVARLFATGDLPFGYTRKNVLKLISLCGVNCELSNQLSRYRCSSNVGCFGDSSYLHLLFFSFTNTASTVPLIISCAVPLIAISRRLLLNSMFFYVQGVSSKIKDSTLVVKIVLYPSYPSLAVNCLSRKLSKSNDQNRKFWE